MIQHLTPAALPVINLQSETLADDLRALDGDWLTVRDAFQILNFEDAGQNGTLVRCNGEIPFADATVTITGSGMYDGTWGATVGGVPLPPPNSFYIGKEFSGDATGRWSVA